MLAVTAEMEHSITRSVFHSDLKPRLFGKSFPPQTFSLPTRLIPQILWPFNAVHSAQRLDLFAWCVRLIRLSVGFRTQIDAISFIHSLAVAAEKKRGPVSRGKEITHEEWLKCNRTQGKAVPPSPIYDSKRSPTSNCYSDRKRHTTKHRGGGKRECIQWRRQDLLRGRAKLQIT